MKILYLECPHCKGIVEIREEDINCAIFRHGIYKSTGLQLNPHASKEECTLVFLNKTIEGCGKPFRFNKEKEVLEICEYI
jgi:hypothetical protein